MGRGKKAWRLSGGELLNRIAGGGCGGPKGFGQAWLGWGGVGGARGAWLAGCPPRAGGVGGVSGSGVRIRDSATPQSIGALRCSWPLARFVCELSRWGLWPALLLLWVSGGSRPNPRCSPRRACPGCPGRPPPAAQVANLAGTGRRAQGSPCAALARARSWAPPLAARRRGSGIQLTSTCIYCSFGPLFVFVLFYVVASISSVDPHRSIGSDCPLGRGPVGRARPRGRSGFLWWRLAAALG